MNLEHDYKVIDECIARFATAMRKQLRANVDKGGWRSCSLDYLLDRLREETRELKKVM